MKSKIPIILTFLGVAIVSFTGSWLVISIKSKSQTPKEVYQLAKKVSQPAELEKVIQDNVKLSGSFTAARVLQHLTVTQLASGGTTFKIYRFNFPETCGKAGCLHVAIDQEDRRSIPLQLVDLPNKQMMFSDAEKAGCLSVKQSAVGAEGTIKDYEVCKKR
jgi:hypothetical protein